MASIMNPNPPTLVTHGWSDGCREGWCKTCAASHLLVVSLWNPFSNMSESLKRETIDCGLWSFVVHSSKQEIKVCAKGLDLDTTPRLITRILYMEALNYRAYHQGCAFPRGECCVDYEVVMLWPSTRSMRVFIHGITRLMNQTVPRDWRSLSLLWVPCLRGSPFFAYNAYCMCCLLFRRHHSPLLPRIAPVSEYGRHVHHLGVHHQDVSWKNPEWSA